MKKECQVCGGPISNGRCKLCGMPYRNDEILYHLNENRRDHYKHASWRARIMMEDEERPLGDKKVQERSQARKKPATGTAARTAGTARRNTNPVNTASGTARRSAGAYQMAGRNSTVAGKNAGTYQTAGRNSTGTYQTVRGNAQTGARTATREIRRGKRNILWLLVLFIIVSVVPAVIEELKDRTGSVYQGIQDDFTDDSWEEADTVLTLTGDDTLVVGTDLEAGSYIFTVTEGYANIRVEHNGNSVMYGLAQDNERKFYLSDGDKIWLEKGSDGTDTENVEVQIWGI